MKYHLTFTTMLLAVTGVAPPAVFAAEGPVFNVTIDDLVIADTVTMADSVGPGFKAHLNFPYLQQRADGTLVANYTVGQTQSGLQFGKQAI
ncbi:MAG: hypothetical protein KC621_14370, partial [Myxococcales bacterium]|nr:hypothetical protein [Myxococcales bacterium]